jgi:hypothetical protein
MGALKFFDHCAEFDILRNNAEDELKIRVICLGYSKLDHKCQLANVSTQRHYWNIPHVHSRLVFICLG